MKKLLLYSIFILAGNSILAQQRAVILNHIAIDVTNLKRSFAFYKDIIGIDSIGNPFHDQRHQWLKIGEHAQLHLIEVPNEIAVHYKGSHLCFTVPSLEDITSKLDRLHIHYEDWVGKANTYTLRPDGVKQIYFQDPDGYWIEINNDRY